MRLSHAAVFFALACAAPALAADFNMDVRVDGIQLGKSVLGPEISAGDLKGRVVMLEFWGINCGPCLASLPHVARLNEELSAFGLIVIGAHAQSGTPEQISAKAKSRGVNFAVVQNARVMDGNDLKGIPHCMVFDHTGKCVYRGNPIQAEVPIREAVGKALADKVDGTPTKSVANVLESLRKGQAPPAALQRALSLSKSSDKDTAEQAKKLVERLTETAAKQLTEVQAQRSQDPIAVLPRFVRLSADFKGTPTGTKASDALSELKKDKVVIAELKARSALEAVRKVDAALQAAAGDGDVKAADFQKAQASVLKQLTSAIRTMKKSWPDAPSTAEALEVAERYALTIK